jgi:hypothetical protein
MGHVVTELRAYLIGRRSHVSSRPTPWRFEARSVTSCSVRCNSLKLDGKVFRSHHFAFCINDYVSWCRVSGRESWKGLTNSEQRSLYLRNIVYKSWSYHMIIYISLECDIISFLVYCFFYQFFRSSWTTSFVPKTCCHCKSVESY